MELIFMGTGTSQGVPMIAYDDHVCDLSDPRNVRTRTSAHVVMGGEHCQIDAGPEFRMQCLANEIRQIDHFFLTHGHADHIMGMDDLRRFCDIRPSHNMPVYLQQCDFERMKSLYPYACRPQPVYKGYPAFLLNEMPEVLELEQGTVQFGELGHGNFTVMGLTFTEKESGKRIAYYTDCNRLSDRAWNNAAEVDVLVIDSLRPHEHPSHFTIDQAVEVSQKLKAKSTYLTHLTHFIDHQTWSDKLPDGVQLAYDGLRVEV